MVVIAYLLPALPRRYAALMPRHKGTLSRRAMLMLPRLLCRWLLLSYASAIRRRYATACCYVAAADATSDCHALPLPLDACRCAFHLLLICRCCYAAAPAFG